MDSLTAPFVRCKFQSTLPAWGETIIAICQNWQADISIHSPRMGRDGLRFFQRIAVNDFNPLSPHGERRFSPMLRRSSFGFQSTLPAWGETKRIATSIFVPHISIHSPRMGRDQGPLRPDFGQTISIHSPRMGRDRCFWYTGYSLFISIHSPRMGRDDYSTATDSGKLISIHSPRMGRDNLLSVHFISPNISIHSPRMGRDWASAAVKAGETISIHSPRMGRDSKAVSKSKL